MDELYIKTLEKDLLAFKNAKEKADKRLLSMEIWMCTLACVFLFAMISIAYFIPMSTTLQIVLFIIGILALFINVCFALKIEQVSGYYVCNKCNHHYVPTYKNVFMAMHIGRTRYMRCPSCNQKSWQKKVIRKEYKFER